MKGNKNKLRNTDTVLSMLRTKLVTDRCMVDETNVVLSCVFPYGNVDEMDEKSLTSA